MTSSRREFLEIGGAATAYAMFGSPTLDAAGEPKLGLIFPPLNYPIPTDAKILYPSGIEFIGNGVGLAGGMTIEGYEEAIPRAIPRAQDLAKQGAKALSMFGSSITFYKGRKFNEELTTAITKATGLPATTQSNGLIEGLRIVNARRVAVSTAYTDIVTERLKVFLEEYGFEVSFARGLGFERIPEGMATPEILLKFGEYVYASSKKADAMVVSCGALKTLDIIVPIEKSIGVPVVSSTPHGLMNAVRLLGVSPRVQGYGAVFAKA
jgi:arylmalonate decarboxylase